MEKKSEAMNFIYCVAIIKLEFNKRNPIINLTRDRCDWENKRIGNKYGWNALHFLCGFNSSEKIVNVIKSLIQLGTDVKFNDIEPRILSRFTSNEKKSFIKEKKKKMVTRSSKSLAEQLVTVREKYIRSIR